MQNDTPEYLLVGPKEEVAGEWRFPKGHIDGVEEPPEMPRNERQGETGMLVALFVWLGGMSSELVMKKWVAKYYLMESFFMT